MVGATHLPRCRLIVVKVTERCNLNCSYCYMFNGGDQSYLRRPPVMSESVYEAMFRRVRAHCERHGIDAFTLVLHGGEPMVAPPKYYRRFFEQARLLIGPEIRLRFAMQTNGTLFTEEWCELFRAYDIGVSFSVDGPEVQNDLHRKDRRGRGTFARVMTGWDLAVAYQLNPGVLVVVDPESDPIETYRLLKRMKPTTADFLLPDATHDKPPPMSGRSATPYADWLLKIFDAWQAEGGSGLRIRLFLQLMRSLTGRSEGYDILGQGNIEVLVVETDGEIQPLDGLRVCADGFADTPYNVITNELDEAYRLPLILQYYFSHSWLPSQCRECDAVKVCGGGFLAHRYSGDQGFARPSVYCQDLHRLIREIGGWLSTRLPKEARDRLVVDPSRLQAPRTTAVPSQCIRIPVVEGRLHEASSHG